MAEAVEPPMLEADLAPGSGELLCQGFDHLADEDVQHVSWVNPASAQRMEHIAIGRMLQRLKELPLP